VKLNVGLGSTRGVGYAADRFTAGVLKKLETDELCVADGVGVGVDAWSSM
jgi:hypothetical protein